MLVELAIADAYGAGLEYVKDDFLKENHDMFSYAKHPTHGLKPGKYTDDTQMTIAVAEALLATNINAIESDLTIKERFAASFVDAFKRDWRNGYARGFQKFLGEIKDSKEFLEKIKPTSDKSGGAMRASPIGLIKNPKSLQRLSRIQASITHDTTDGLAAAEAAALMVHFFYYNLGKREEVGVFLNDVISLGDHDWNSDYDERIKSKGWMSVKAAITAIKRNNSLRDILEDICWMGGDVDTAATVAISAASCSDDIIKNLPDSLYWGLENGKYGREYLHRLDQKLLERFSL